MKRLITGIFLLACLAVGTIAWSEGVEFAGAVAYVKTLFLNGSDVGYGSVAPNPRTASKYLFDWQFERSAATQIANATGAIAIGRRHTVSGADGLAIGGNSHSVGNSNAYAIGGNLNTSGGSGAGCLGGTINNAGANNSLCVAGYRGLADKAGQIAHPVAGDPGAGFTLQNSEILAWRLATDSAVTRLTLTGAADGAGTRWTIASGSVWTGQIHVVGIATNSARLSCSYNIRFHATRVNSTVTVATISRDIYEAPGLEGCDAGIYADSTNGAVYVGFVGSSTTNLRVCATANFSEVNQP